METDVCARKKKGASFLSEIRKNRTMFFMLCPVVLYVIMFCYLPMTGIVLAFKNFNFSKGIFGSDWCGLKNFRFLFVSGDVYRVTFNTVAYNVAFIISGIILNVGAAVFLSEIPGVKFKKVAQTMLLLPYFVSWVVTGAIVYNIFGSSGVINGLLKSFGRQPQNFMSKTSLWPWLFIAFNAWKNVGYNSVVYLAAITGMDPSIYEAAEIDGAGIFQRIRYITLPLLKKTVVVLLLLGLGNIVRGDFGLFYNVTGNNPLLYSVSDIIDTYVYRCLMTSQNFSMSTAAGIYQSFLGFAIIMAVNGIIKRVQPDYALF